MHVCLPACWRARSFKAHESICVFAWPSAWVLYICRSVLRVWAFFHIIYLLIRPAHACFSRYVRLLVVPFLYLYFMFPKCHASFLAISDCLLVTSFARFMLCCLLTFPESVVVPLCTFLVSFWEVAFLFRVASMCYAFSSVVPLNLVVPSALFFFVAPRYIHPSFPIRLRIVLFSCLCP